MGISGSLANEMEALFNHWPKVRITDKELKKLIAIAMAPSKEVLNSLQEEKFHHLSSHYLNIVGNDLEYALAVLHNRRLPQKVHYLGLITP